MCTFRDGWGDLSKLNAQLLAISGDYVFSHMAWAKAEKLTFPLLQDHDHAVAKLYGSFNPQNGVDRRTVFLIDKDGVIRYKNMSFRAGAKEDYAALREALEKLQTAN
jgi:peroxiredoxin